MRKRDDLIKIIIRLYRGMEELAQRPYKVVGGILILVLFAVVWKHREVWFRVPFLPDNITEFLHYAISFLLIICVAICILAWVKQVGLNSSQSDEDSLMVVFSAEELAKGHPMLISRGRIKGTDVVFRRYYSPISIERWETRRSELEYQMSETFVKPYIEKSGKRQITIYTLPDNKKKDRGILYDDI